MPTTSRSLLAFVLVTVVGVSVLARQQTPLSVDRLLGEGLHHERVEGDLEAAIATYKSVVYTPGVTRRQAAIALLHWAFCAERLGFVEARHILERIVRDYADQRDLALQARRRLARLGGLGADAPAVPRRLLAPLTDANAYMRPSPDGYRFSVAWGHAAENLAIRNVRDGSTRVLTNEPVPAGPAVTPFITSSAWSSDGRQIAYSWLKDRLGELRNVNVETGVSRVLWSNRGRAEELDRVVDWVPAASRIAACFVVEDRSELRFIDSRTGSLVGRVPVPDCRSTARVSPDGRYVAVEGVSSRDRLNIDILLIPAAGGTVVPLVEHPATERLFGWSTDGRSIVFSSNRSGTNDLYALDVADGQPRGQPRLLAEALGRITPKGVAADGSVFYLRDTGSSEVYLARADMEKRTLETPRPVGRYPGSANRYPSFSPDGRFIAYLSASPASALAEATDDVLSIQPVDAEDYRSFSSGVRFQGGPFRLDWFADGRSLLVYGAEKNWSGLYRVDVGTGQADWFLRDSSTLSSLMFSAVSADRKEVFVYRARQAPGAIVVQSIGTGTERVIYRSGGLGAILSLAPSPDGRSLLFIEADYGSRSLAARVLPVDGGEARTVLARSSMGLAGAGGAWAHDGRYVFCWVNSGDENGPRSAALWLVPASGGDPVQIMTSAPITGLDVSPDDRFVGFSSRTGGRMELWSIGRVAGSRTRAVIGQRETSAAASK